MPSTTIFLCGCDIIRRHHAWCALFSFRSIVLVKSIIVSRAGRMLVASTTFRLCFCWNNTFVPWHHLDALPTLVPAGKKNLNGSEKLNMERLCEWCVRINSMDSSSSNNNNKQQTTNNSPAQKQWSRPTLDVLPPWDWEYQSSCADDSVYFLLSWQTTW